MNSKTPSDVADLLDRLRDEEFERLVEERIAQRAPRDALLWRFRLTIVEAIMMSGLILAAGLVLGKPLVAVTRAALCVGAACLASGLLLIGLSGLGTYGFRRLRNWVTRP